MPSAPADDLTILIVEDDSPARLGLALALEPRVGQVLQAEDGHLGLELFSSHAPDVVITDIRMPRLDGLSMIRQIRQQGSDPFVIVASGHGAEEAYLQAIDLGVNLFIKKPYRLQDILQGLERAVTEVSRRKRDAYRRALTDGLLAHVPNCHLLTDGKTVCYFADPQAILPAQAAEGQDLGPFLRGHFTQTLRHGMARSSLPQGIDAWLERHKGREFVLAGNTQDKPGRYLMRIDHIRLHGQQRYLLSFTDISRIESERERFYQLAGRDFLTGVGNRQAFESELSRETGRANRYGSDLCLIMIDVDDFKQVNDTFGHQTGDAVLVALARRISTGVRVTDVVCRFGGEEFMVIMPQTGLDGALSCARKLAQDVASQDFGIARPLTISLGLALYRPGETPQTLVRRVDTALYDAKNTGKNRVVVAGEAAFECVSVKREDAGRRPAPDRGVPPLDPQ